MPRGGYKKRFFTNDFKVRTVYEIKSGLKKADAIVDEKGKPILKLLVDRWVEQFEPKQPIQDFFPSPQAEALPSYRYALAAQDISEEDLLREIGRMHIQLQQYTRKQAHKVFDKIASK
jgi:hypothetical protein